MEQEAVAMDRSVREFDSNGWFEIAENPISKVGIFNYSGAQIPGAPDPTKLYRVYRPAEELSDPDCLNSFRLLPWIDNHVMLGAEDGGLTPAERKGVQGVIGEKVRFDETSGKMLVNLKVFSQSLASLIEAGKRELSAGYRCKYDWTPGVFQGQAYDAVQRCIRGNHLALVHAGRMGPDVAVLDGLAALDHFTFTFDAKDVAMGDETKPDLPDTPEEAKGMTLEDALAAIQAFIPVMQKIQELAAAMAPKVEETVADEQRDELAKPAVAVDAAEPKPAAKKPEVTAKPAVTKPVVVETPAAVMDEAAFFKSMTQRLNAREQLYARLSPIVGAFDHAEMSEAEVALYGVKKLGLKAKAGQEYAMLDGYLQAAAKESKKAVAAMDEGPKDNWLTRQLKKEA